MFCKCCGKPVKGTVCELCGKEAILHAYSQDLADWMSQPSVSDGADSISKTDTLSTEATYRKGYLEGINVGKHDGRTEGSSSTNSIWMKRVKVALAVTCIVFVFVGGLCAFLGYRRGYNAGYVIGKTSGYNRGLTDGEEKGHDSGYNEGIKYLRSEISTAYDAGYNKGKEEALTTPTPSFALTTSPSVTPIYKLGSEGEPITLIQERLQELGYYTIKIDGLYGPGTEAAVSEFQNRNGLSPTGVVDKETMEKLLSIDAIPKLPPSEPSSATPLGALVETSDIPSLEPEATPSPTHNPSAANPQQSTGN